ncbi:SCO6880 family protein [Corynebacterium senegalense]|uniref:SCO6880 family protein n=1 Tax=Corynebacterium senegalense TaxID=2080750 RepID=UPI000E203333|nr:SCO6880 family protein [Corynebacterium senegalense]
MTSHENEVTVPQYSLGQPPRRTGLGGLSMMTTAIIAVGFMTFLLVQFSGLGFGVGLVVLAITAAVAGLVTFQWGNRSLATMARLVGQHSLRRRRGEDVYLSGEMSKVPGGFHRLPGSLARTYLVEGADSDHQDFAAIVDAPARTATVLFDCQMTGQTPMTQEERNQKTAEWARWLALLSLSGDIEHVATVVGVRPGTGQLVAQEVEAIVADDIPPVAAQIMGEAAQLLSVGVPEVVAHIAVTFHVDGEALKDNAFMDSLATRLPSLYRQLAWAGVIAVPMSADQTVARVHQFFNPPAEPDFEELNVMGQKHGMSWEDAGPGFARARAASYDHEGCTSVTWEMREAPRSTFEDGLLTGLLSPHERIERKRVALVYRPFEAGKGVSRVEGEHRDAMVAANSSKSIRSANAELRLEHTDAARRAQARGAQLGRYSLFVTATVTDREQLERVEHDIAQLGAGASVRLQKMMRQQDTGFITTCGVGQVPWQKESTDLF